MGQCQALYEVSEFVSQPAILIEEIFGANEQLTDGLGVYEITPKEEDDESEDEDPAKLYSTGEKRFDEPTSAVEEPTKEINLGTENDPRNVIISLNLNVEEESALIQVLKEYKDTFAWTYKDMPGLDPALVEHRLPIKPGAKAVKQKLR